MKIFSKICIYFFSKCFPKFVYIFFQNFFQNSYIDNNSSENLHTLFMYFGEYIFLIYIHLMVKLWCFKNKINN